MCQHCNQNNFDIHFLIEARYFHFFWVPFLPYRKKKIAVCPHCKKVLTYRKMDDNMKDIAKQVAKEYSYPIITFARPIIIMSTIVIGIIATILDT